MTKVEALQTIKLLSALESWTLSQQAKLPDYLHEYIVEAMELLERIILDTPQDMTPQETYTDGTPILYASTKHRI